MFFYIMNVLNILKSLKSKEQIINKIDDPVNDECSYVFAILPERMDDIPEIQLQTYSKKYMKVLNLKDIRDFFANKGATFYFGVNKTNSWGVIPSVDNTQYECRHCSEDIFLNDKDDVIYHCTECNRYMCNTCKNECDQHTVIKKYYTAKQQTECLTCKILIYDVDECDDEYYKKDEIDSYYYFLPHYTNLKQDERLYNVATVDPLINICKQCFETNTENAKKIVDEHNMRFLDKNTPECYSFHDTEIGSIYYWIPVLKTICDNLTTNYLLVNLNPDHKHYGKVAFQNMDDEDVMGFHLIQNYSLDEILHEIERASHILHVNDDDTDDDSSITSENTYKMELGEGDYDRIDPIRMIMCKKLNFFTDYHSHW